MIERGTLPGFQKPQSSKPKPVGLAVITYYGDYRAGCTCGWGTGHTRTKVLEDRIDKHIENVHSGRGIRL